MPTMTLTVTSIAAEHLGWSPTGGTNAAVLGSDDGLGSSGASYTRCSTNGAALDGIAMSNPTVAEGDIASITSVRFLGTGRCTARGSAGSDVDFEFRVPSGFSETLNFFNNVNYEVEYGTTRTAKPDSSAWSYSDIEGLQFDITKNGTNSVELSYFAAEVVYVEAAVTDNAVFFGTNF